MAVNKTGWVEFVCKIILFSENNSLKVGKKSLKTRKTACFVAEFVLSRHVNSKKYAVFPCFVYYVE